MIKYIRLISLNIFIINLYEIIYEKNLIKCLNFKIYWIANIKINETFNDNVTSKKKKLIILFNSLDIYIN